MELATLDESQTLYRNHALHGERQIRVFDLEPSETFEAPLRASMKVVQVPEVEKFESADSNRSRLLSDPLAYQTLSYAWGDPIMTSAIFIDGMRTPVTPHLEAGLKRIREKLRPAGVFMPTLWVDAICINQNDLDEQSQQVMIMGDVYAFAKRLIIWLGEASESQIRKSQSSSTEEVRDYLLELVDSPYFRRRWVLQEVFLSQLGARHVLHGGTRKRLELLMHNINTHVPSKLLDEVPILKTHDSHHRFSAEWSQWPLSMLMLRHRHSQCQRPHDRVFALLGLWPMHKNFRVDYTMQVDDINREIAKKEILTRGQSGDALRVLICATFTHRIKASGDPLPSWVPNWQQVRAPVNEYHGAMLRMLDTYDPSHAAEMLRSGLADIWFDERKDVLYAEGWMLHLCNHQHQKTDCVCCIICADRTTPRVLDGSKVRLTLQNLALAPQEQVLLVVNSDCLLIVSPRVDEEDIESACALEYVIYPHWARHINRFAEHLKKFSAPRRFRIV